MKSNTRKVKKRSVNNRFTISSKQSGYNRAQKARLRSQQRAKKLVVTQAKRYLIYSVGCFLSSQAVKFILYTVLFRGDSSPTGFGFLLIVYIQTGLLLFTFIFFVLAVFKGLQRLFNEY